MPLSEAVSFAYDRCGDLLALDVALGELEELDARKCQVVELRYFGGLVTEEIARTLGISAQTVRRDLRMAEAWLLHEMRRE